MSSQLKFQPFSSVTAVSFWHEFASKKLNEYKLSEDAIPVRAFYESSRSPKIPARLALNNTSFDATSSSSDEASCVGQLWNMNTVESFKKLDKQALLQNAAKETVANILSGAAEQDPHLLVPFLAISFADLKKHKFIYWFAFPAVVPPSPFMTNAPPASIFDRFADDEALALVQQVVEQGGKFSFALGVKDKSSGKFSVLPLSAFEDVRDNDNICVIFRDPCALLEHPGWPLRNLLLLVFGKWKLHKVTVVCFREILGTVPPATIQDAVAMCTNHSIVFDATCDAPFDLAALDLSDPKCVVGWEANNQGKMGPRLMNLSDQLDPVRLAASACDLNLRLMRWRALPDLSTEKLANTKCLLIGAGTLGCNVARDLLGWGFRNITFVDNGRVSFSNPVRQSLFTFDDCLEGGKHKATAAAEALKRIFPGVNSNGVVLNIPMPGHMVSEKEVQGVRRDVDTLEELIKTHDVVALLTDTRESRWLPTLLATKHHKLTLNAALGFDSLLVMRHGFDKESGPATDKLGCYFCNDVVAPQNSMRDRTLDQQCTVTRPGLAPMASALLVELLVGLLHHPDQGLAKAPDNNAQNEQEATKFGILPHQIRGFLPSFSMIAVSGPAFAQCTGCSKRMVDNYTGNGFDMLLQVFNNPQALEDMTGLTELQQGADLDNIDLDWDDEGDI